MVMFSAHESMRRQETGEVSTVVEVCVTTSNCLIYHLSMSLEEEKGVYSTQNLQRTTILFDSSFPGLRYKGKCMSSDKSKFSSKHQHTVQYTGKAVYVQKWKQFLNAFLLPWCQTIVILYGLNEQCTYRIRVRGSFCNKCFCMRPIRAW